MIYERIIIGVKIAEYKEKEGRKRYNPGRERQIIAKAKKGAEERGLNPGKIGESFLFLMQLNRKMQELYEQDKIPEKLKEVVKYF